MYKLIKFQINFMTPCIWGSLISAGIGYIGSRKANKDNTSNFNNNLAFQRENAKNAHQWEAQDLEKAGLNRILGYSKGGGGAQASGGSALPKIENTASSAHAMRIAEKIAKFQGEKAQAEAEKAQAEAANARESLPNISKQGENISADTGLKRQQSYLANSAQNLNDTTNQYQQQQLQESAARTKSILAEVKNIKQRNKNLQQEWNISNAQWRELELKLPEIKYQAYLDSTQIVKVLHAIEKGIPVGKAVGAAVGGSLFLKNQAKGKTTKSQSTTTKHKKSGTSTTKTESHTK